MEHVQGRREKGKRGRIEIAGNTLLPEQYRIIQPVVKEGGRTGRLKTIEIGVGLTRQRRPLELTSCRLVVLVGTNSDV